MDQKAVDAAVKEGFDFVIWRLADVVLTQTDINPVAVPYMGEAGGFDWFDFEDVGEEVDVYGGGLWTRKP